MKAILYRKYGGPETLEVADVPKPQPGTNQLLLKVRTSAVNPVDWKRASGKYRLILPVRFPAIPGFDVAGEVVEVGPGVTTFSPGMQVHARISNNPQGTCAEYVLAGIDVTTPIPEGMDVEQAAGLPLAGMTALQGLRDEAGLQMKGSTQKVLVSGASGGVGHLAVQIAKATGAHVTGVCSEKNFELVRSLGADEVIDYKKPDAFQSYQRVFDIVFDCVSGNPSPWLPLLQEKGCYVSAVPEPKTFLRKFINPLTSKRVSPVMLKSNARDLAFLDELFVQKKLKVLIDSRYPLENLRGAWERSISGRAAGKIVIQIL